MTDHVTNRALGRLGGNFQMGCMNSGCTIMDSRIALAMTTLKYVSKASALVPISKTHVDPRTSIRTAKTRLLTSACNLATPHAGTIGMLTSSNMLTMVYPMKARLMLIQVPSEAPPQALLIGEHWKRIVKAFASADAMLTKARSMIHFLVV